MIREVQDAVVRLAIRAEERERDDTFAMWWKASRIAGLHGWVHGSPTCDWHGEHNEV